MIIVLTPDADPKKVEGLRKQLQGSGFVVQDIKGESTTMMGLAGDTSTLTPESFMSLDFVKTIIKVQEPYKLAGMSFHPERSVISVGGRKIGGGHFAVAAGALFGRKRRTNPVDCAGRCEFGSKLPARGSL